MLKKIFIILAAMFFTANAQPAFSQSSPAERAQAIMDSLKVLCLAGGSESTTSVKGDLELKAKIKDILSGNIGAAANGATEFNKHVWDGIIGGISKDMTEIQARQASETRKCMQDTGAVLIQDALKQR